MNSEYSRFFRLRINSERGETMMIAIAIIIIAQIKIPFVNSIFTISCPESLQPLNVLPPLPSNFRKREKFLRNTA